MARGLRDGLASENGKADAASLEAAHAGRGRALRGFGLGRDGSDRGQLGPAGHLEMGHPAEQEAQRVRGLAFGPQAPAV